MSTSNNTGDFTTGSIAGKLISFMLPILGALILQSMYSAVDLLIVGRFGTTSGISGVATGSNIMNMFTFILAALTTAVTVNIGSYLGQKNTERLGKLVGGAVVFFAIVAIVVSFLLVVLARPLAILLQAPEEALDLTVLYIRICGVGYIFVVFYNFISSIFRGLGDSNLPLLFVGIACVVNIIGDLILVAGLNMNVAGAAIATIAAQAISVILSLLIIKKRGLPFKITKSDYKLNIEVTRFIKLGMPLMVQELLTQVSFLALMAFINHMGLDASSGYGVAQKIQGFVMLLPAALMQSMAPFISQNVGANQEDRAKRGLITGIAFGASIGFFVMLAVFFKGDLLSSAFTSDAAVIARSFEFLRGFAPEAVVTCFLFSFMGYFNGHGKSFFVMAQSIAQSFLIRLPMSYLMSIRPNASLTGVGFAAPTATVFGIIICFIYFFKMQKNMKNNTV